jgi:NTP pyrophosphatase (non-canonical NTP hydrolase)
MDKKIMYYIYHIPGKKVGVTRNLKDRVTTQQGYAVTEYEVLDSSTDIDYISKREIELQQSYDYKIDRKLYKNLFNNMKINATEQTSTFPFPMEELKEKLNNNLGQTWDTLHGTFKLTKDTVDWIVVNARESMYNELRSYVYNKAFFEKFVNKAKLNLRDIQKSIEDGFVKHKPTRDTHPKDDRFQLIRNWAKARGLYAKGDTKTQYCKLMEEAGELGRAILKDDQPEFVDAIGDMVVVLTNLAHLGNTTIEACVDAAYAEIKTRKGKMENGTFVKS